VRHLSANNPSYWIASTPDTSFSELRGEQRVDVAIIGGGIFGITAGHLLKAEGRTVAIIEGDRIARGVTGYTTAKISSSQHLIYSQLTNKHGEDAARLYGESNEAAKEKIADLVEELSIDCDFERQDNFVYTESDSDLASVQEEVEVAARLGLPASFVTESPLPFPIKGAVRFTNQAQFHPRKYLLALADRIPGDGSFIFEGTTALDVEEGEPCRVETSHGAVLATDVIVATNLPFLDRGLFFTKVHPKRSYAVAGYVTEGVSAPTGMYLSVESPTRSYRIIRDGERDLLMVGGEGHKVGEVEDTEACYQRLEADARRRFGLEKIDYRWSTQDGVPVDSIPYIGRLTRSSEHLLTGTGFRKWGMTNGTLAAQLLTDRIVGRENAWAELYDSKRLDIAPSAKEFVKENLQAAYRWVADRVDTPGVALEELPPGEGTVIRKGLSPVAVYKEEDGSCRGLSAVCTHLACIVHWNNAEKSWDCPCHGSRYDLDGSVIQGPATEPLEPRGL
jgi:glycine/D-amino acid oxidase-like deaminating enzyme/nitrite reductase/ring-hydroxylating ferredoxin subunit